MKKKPVWIVYELVKKKVSFINFLMMHFLFKTDFLLTISSRQVMRIKKNISKGIITWSNTKFS